MLRPSWRLSRRRFLRLALALGAAASGGLGTLLPRTTGNRAVAGPEPATRAATWTLALHDLAPEPGHERDVLISPVWSAPFPFNGVGVRWDLTDGAAGTPLPFEFRASDGGAWTPWRAAPALHDFDGTPAPATDLLLLSGTGLQFRLRRGPEPAVLRSHPARIVVTVLDTRAGPTAVEADRTAIPLTPLGYRQAAISNPNLIGRAGWGANENYRFRNGKEVWARRYLSVRKIIIHHTVTSNSPPDPAASVRAIYYYHAVTLGWGDIGYNFLVDHNGRVYEGRAGGTNAQGLPVMGGHALRYNAGSLGIALLGNFGDSTTPVPDAMWAALANLVSYKAVQHGIHPTGTDFFVDKVLPNIMGHRDALATSCPGDAVYARLTALRQQVLANLPPLGQSWINQQVPAVMQPGATAAGLVVVRNSGSQPWLRAGATSVQVGYRWFQPDGREIQEPGLSAPSDLPKDVLPGQEVAVPIRIQAPQTPGALVLNIDLLQGGRTFFSAAVGNEPLVVPVTVKSDHQFRIDLPWITRTR
ncbi:MAG: N-acetylmuramoyl-L-alanine amidase [Chloroflexi bacterium]|nr:N-acetylmuramoyl-L-alanine amidase [Chloroflexota bacterium]